MVVHVTAAILLLVVTCVPDTYERLAMEKLIVVCLIHDVIYRLHGAMALNSMAL